MTLMRRPPNLFGALSAGIGGLGELIGTAIIVKSAKPKQGQRAGLSDGCTPCAAAARADAVQAAVRLKKGKW